MSVLEPYSSREIAARAYRQVGRAVSRVENDGVVRRTRIDVERDVVTDKIEAIGQITGRALQTAALVSQMEQQLALTVPAASGRLAVIADASAITMTSLISDAACTLRRL